MTREVIARRDSHGNFGIDVDDQNMIVRLVPGSAAHADGALRVGDVVEAVNGRKLRGRYLKQLLAKCPPGACTFTVASEEWEESEGSEELEES